MTCRSIAALLALTFATPALADPAGIWALVAVDGAPVAYTATLTLDEAGKISGKAPCNRYFGSVEGTLPEFRPTGIGSTKMACDALADESAYFALLGGVDRLTASETELHLSGAGHSLIFRPAQ